MGAKKILVIGGGVIGLSTALALKEAGHEVEMWSRDLPRTTTSWVSGAFFYPMRLQVDRAMATWLRDSFDHYCALAQHEPTAGVILREAVEILRGDDQAPAWMLELPGTRDAKADELPQSGLRGVIFRCPVIDTHIYLEWLRLAAHKAGIRQQIRAVSSLALTKEAADITVLATGLHARDLVADTSLEAVRGQILVLDRPVVRRAILDEKGPHGLTYIVPRQNTCILGSVAQPGDASLDIRDDDTRAIVQRCTALAPALAAAKVIDVRVGLRPSRPQICLEAKAPTAHAPPLITNYGHGGAGITLSWGCAQAVARLAAATS